eukprot:1763816-Alexandrium_andersonii.AAC.1
MNACTTAILAQGSGASKRLIGAARTPREIPLPAVEHSRIGGFVAWLESWLLLQGLLAHLWRLLP